MNAALRKTCALTSKDLADLFKNPGMAVCLVIPVALVFFQVMMIGDAGSEAAAARPEASAMIASTFLQSALCMSIAMIGSMAVLYSLAEEKEKHTLRTLILSNVSAGQIMVAKAVVGTLAIVFVAAACFGVVWYQLPGVNAALLPAYLLLVLAGSATVVLPSLVLGLACRDQMTASFYSVPVVMLPIFGAYSEELGAVVLFAPTGGVAKLLGMAVMGTFSWGDAVPSLVVTAAWIVAGAAAFKLLYRRLARDN